MCIKNNYVKIIGTCIIFPPALAGTLHWRARLCQCQCRPPPAEPACLHPAPSPGRGGEGGEGGGGEGGVREGMEGYNMYSVYILHFYTSSIIKQAHHTLVYMYSMYTRMYIHMYVSPAMTRPAYVDKFIQVTI